MGCRVLFGFPICKLLDCVQRAEAGARAAQPAAVVILANWLAQRTRGDMPERLRFFFAPFIAGRREQLFLLERQFPVMRHHLDSVAGFELAK